ncbi:flagellar protein FlgN [uncultured Pelagimonas sp.]|uniref:flagellar protein FlgN n=1 Tax=uncultured Pelagimonas sp. TaxID=1618102 RepID=UPI002631AB4D|nr:flagellar protein FlgN [uncultured Pelagimonas sp.]
MTDVSLTEQLEVLLLAEREALLAGDFEKIAELLEIKEIIAEKLGDQKISTQELAPLQDGMRRNQELFDQALAGIRNVASRLGDLQRVRRSMDTYDAYGRRMTIDAPQEKKLERRA